MRPISLRPRSVRPTALRPLPTRTFAGRSAATAAGPSRRSRPPAAARRTAELRLPRATRSGRAVPVRGAIESARTFRARRPREVARTIRPRWAAEPTWTIRPRWAVEPTRTIRPRRPVESTGTIGTGTIRTWRSIEATRTIRPRRPIEAAGTIRTRRPFGFPRPGVAPQLLGESTALFVPGDLETIARVGVLAAGPPVARARLPGCAALGDRVGALLLLRFPQTSARKPLHHGVGMARLQLTERGRELLLRVGAKCGGLSLEDDRPVMVPGRHAPDYGSFADRPFGSSRFSFSINVVRFRLSSFAACRLLPWVRSSERRMSDSSTASI